MDPGPEQVVFDTVLEVATGHYDVEPADAGASAPNGPNGAAAHTPPG